MDAIRPQRGPTDWLLGLATVIATTASAAVAGRPGATIPWSAWIGVAVLFVRVIDDVQPGADDVWARRPERFPRARYPSANLSYEAEISHPGGRIALVKGRSRGA